MNHMRRRWLLFATAALVAAPLARAQQPAKVARIGYLSGGTSQSGVANFKALTAGLDALGWNEGRNLAIEARYVGTGVADIPVWPRNWCDSGRM